MADRSIKDRTWLDKQLAFHFNLLSDYLISFPYIFSPKRCLIPACSREAERRTPVQTAAMAKGTTRCSFPLGQCVAVEWKTDHPLAAS